MNPVRPLLRVRESVAYRAEKLLRDKVLDDDSVYRDHCYATDTRWILALKTVIRPERLLEQAAYGQALRLPQSVTRAVRKPPTPADADLALADRIVGALRQNGMVKLEGHFADLAQRLADRHEIRSDRFEPSDAYWRKWVSPTGSEELTEFSLDPTLLTAVSRYYGAQPFHRDTPAVNVTYPTVSGDEAIESGKMAADWHYDTPNLISIHLLLCDVEPTGSRMLYARKSHRHRRAALGASDRRYSEEYVRGRYEIADCAGPIGTVYVFDNNGLHRLDPVPGSFRSTCEIYFTPGNRLITLEERRASGNSDEIKLDDSIWGELALPPGLSELQARSLDGVLGVRGGA